MKRNKGWIFKLASAVGVLALLAVSQVGLSGAEPRMDEKKLHEMALSAKTPAEHATVAKHYRLRAENFEAKAKSHDAEVRRLSSGPVIGIDAKWPAMARKTWQQERQHAMEARRAAEECYAVADRHVRLAVEAGFAE